MENFGKIQELVHEYEDLESTRKTLTNIHNDVAIVFNNYDGAGLNYSKCSKYVKDLLIKSINIRLEDICKQFN